MTRRGAHTGLGFRARLGLLPRPRRGSRGTNGQRARPEAAATQLDVPAIRRILVPMKIGAVGEEMVATAVRLASERGATVEALHVIRVPLELDLTAVMVDAERRADESLAEARSLGAEAGVAVVATTIRARSLGRAIVDHAAATGADLILLGSAHRWRRQSRVFSPTVDFVLRNAPSEVLIVAFPNQVSGDELALG